MVKSIISAARPSDSFFCFGKHHKHLSAHTALAVSNSVYKAGKLVVTRKNYIYKLLGKNAFFLKHTAVSVNKTKLYKIVGAYVYSRSAHNVSLRAF